MNHTLTDFGLQLIHPFGISRGITTTNPVLFFELEGGGVGECSPVKYKKQTVSDARVWLEKFAGLVTEENQFDLDTLTRKARAMAPDASAACAAFDLALHDRCARAVNLPLYKFMGFPKPQNPLSSFTIGIDTDEKMVEKTLEAASFPLLKIKLGRDDADRDMTTLRKIREAAPGKVIRVDANCGWSLETAKKCSFVCADLGIEFIEQPLAIGSYEALAEFKRVCPLPVIADEDVQDLQSLVPLVGKVDGINIKLMKSTGLWEARQMIAFARAHDWQVMLGCMIESSIGIAAAAHLAGAAVALDLDSELLIGNNPCTPGAILQPNGELHVSDRPGLGVELALPR
ncbi:MAG: dipeptide epimerase [Candidatus Sumerlaeia bacterium]|nr:dipeptide epimerase [Candidatus Sumerlaeia bacterium]